MAGGSRRGEGKGSAEAEAECGVEVSGHEMTLHTAHALAGVAADALLIELPGGERVDRYDARCLLDPSDYTGGSASHHAKQRSHVYAMEVEQEDDAVESECDKERWRDLLMATEDEDEDEGEDEQSGRMDGGGTYSAVPFSYGESEGGVSGFYTFDIPFESNEDVEKPNHRIEFDLIMKVSARVAQEPAERQQRFLDELQSRAHPHLAFLRTTHRLFRFFELALAHALSATHPPAPVERSDGRGTTEERSEGRGTTEAPATVGACNPSQDADASPLPSFPHVATPPRDRVELMQRLIKKGDATEQLVLRTQPDNPAFAFLVAQPPTEEARYYYLLKASMRAAKSEQ